MLTLDQQVKSDGWLEKVVINTNADMEMVTQDLGHVKIPLAGWKGMTQFVYPNPPTNALPAPVKAYANTVADATAATTAPVVTKTAAPAPKTAASTTAATTTAAPVVGWGTVAGISLKT